MNYLRCIIAALGSLAWITAALPVNDSCIDINSEGDPEHEVRFTSGKTLFVEGLVDGQWVTSKELP